MNPQAGMPQPQQFPGAAQLQTAPQVQLPDIYYYDTRSQEPGSLRESIKKADAFGVISSWIENPLLTAGTCFGIFKGFFDLLC